MRPYMRAVPLSSSKLETRNSKLETRNSPRLAENRPHLGRGLLRLLLRQIVSAIQGPPPQIACPRCPDRQRIVQLPDHAPAAPQDLHRTCNPPHRLLISQIERVVIGRGRPVVLAHRPDRAGIVTPMHVLSQRIGSEEMASPG